jgi:hypothetical protein
MKILKIAKDDMKYTYLIRKTNVNRIGEFKAGRYKIIAIETNKPLKFGEENDIDQDKIIWQ